ncbi:MAG: nucleotide exchange factor GrpE [Solirubrobacterales bacterium]
MSGAEDGRQANQPRPAGPAAAGDPPPPPGAKASSGEVPPTTSPAAEAEEVEHDLDTLLVDAEAKRDEYLDLAKRTKADFENYRKRMAADVQAAAIRGRSEMARELIDAVDNLERALANAGESRDGLIDGVEMVLRGMQDALTRNGIEPVDPKGEKFDPTQHEALSTMPVEGAEPGVVVEVMQKGYRLADQLIRPARVVVSA